MHSGQTNHCFKINTQQGGMRCSAQTTPFQEIMLFASPVEAAAIRLLFCQQVLDKDESVLLSD